MKTTLLLATACAITTATAQITVNSGHFMNAGESVLIGIDTAPTIGHTAAGANQTWNYSDLSDYESDNLAFGAHTWYAGYQHFPTANLGSVDGDGFSSFFRKNDLAFDLLGVYGDIFGDGQPVPVSFAPEYRLLTFPSTYGTEFSNTSVLTLTIPADFPFETITVKVTFERESLIDSWGTITTPFGTFNTIRQRMFEVQSDSVWGTSFGISTLLDSGQSESESYTFWTDNASARYSLLEYTLDPTTDGVTNVRWQAASPVASLTTIEEKEFVSVYPNPTSDYFTIDSKNETVNFSIIDVSGKLIMSGSVQNGATQVPVHMLAEGTYIVRLVDSEQHVSEKRIVIAR
jgi:hypothetical protein